MTASAARYGAMAQRALGMIQRAGIETTLTRIAQASVNEARDVASGGPQSQAVVAAVFPASSNRSMTDEQRADRRVNYRNVLMGGRKPDGSALDFEPATNQKITLEGVTWTVQPGPVRLAPDGGAPIYFDFEVRR